MPEFLPFIATRFERERVELSRVVAPPYDIISNALRDELYERDEHNIVRIDYSREADPYASASEAWVDWHGEGVLRDEPIPRFYVYTQIFRGQDGEQLTRTGVLGRLRLSEYSSGEVRPHERTYDWPKSDRLNLMEATHANISPIFGVIQEPMLLFDQTLEIATVRPAIADIDERLPDGSTVRHLLWALHDEQAADRIQRLVASLPVTIADGHHRYETALEYHRRHPEQLAAAYTLAFLSNLAAEGTVILPTHRVLHDVAGFEGLALLAELSKQYDLETVSSREEARTLLGSDQRVLGVIELPDQPGVVAVRSRATSADPAELPAAWLEREVLRGILKLSEESLKTKQNLHFPHSFEELDALKGRVSWQAAFLMRAVRPEEMLAIVEKGGFMPQKTTFFYPKLLTGLVMHAFDAQPAR